MLCYSMLCYTIVHPRSMMCHAAAYSPALGARNMRAHLNLSALGSPPNNNDNNDNDNDTNYNNRDNNDNDDNNDMVIDNNDNNNTSNNINNIK